MPSHYRPYKLECSTCNEVAALHLRADLLRPHIDGLFPRPTRQRDSLVDLTPKEQVAADWTLGIANCLRLGMAAHSRCASCSILLGLGHEELGIGGFCSTHGAAHADPIAARETPTEVLSWIAGNRGH